jgi:hypothetical protein
MLTRLIAWGAALAVGFGLWCLGIFGACMLWMALDAGLGVFR